MKVLQRLKRPFLKPVSWEQRQRGMTIIEILIVVALIATLLGYLISNFGAQADRAKISQAQIAMGNLDQVCQLYRVRTGKFPAKLQDLVDSGDTEANKIKDPWNNEFQYETDGRKIKITSAGPDGAFGTDDDIIYPAPTQPAPAGDAGGAPPAAGGGGDVAH